MWTLVKNVGASDVSGAIRRWAADQAAEHGMECSFTLTAPPYDPTNMEDYFKSNEAMKAHLDLYDIAQYRDHPGVSYYILAGEPCGSYNFDPQNPPQEVLDLIEVLKYGVQYIKSLDPTHPVTVNLCPAGAWVYEQPDSVWIEKRKAWINLFIDWIDVLDYHLYLDGDAGNEYWRNPELMRSRLTTMLDQVLIPCSKGKPIIIGETGCPSPGLIDWKGQYASFTEDQQAEYFRIFGEETTKRGIFVYVFKLIDADAYGLFRFDRGTTMNVAKKAAGLVEGYLSVDQPKHVLAVNATPVSVPFTFDGVSKSTPYSESLDEKAYTIVMSSNVSLAGTIYTFVRWEGGSTNPTRVIDLTGDMSLLATYEIAPSPELGKPSPQVDETNLRMIMVGVSMVVMITVLWKIKRREYKIAIVQEF